VLRGELFGFTGESGDIRLLDVIGRRLHEFGLAARRRAFATGQVEVG